MTVQCCEAAVQQYIHRIHRRQHVSEDDAGISKHRLSPYNAYYHNSHFKLYSFRFKFRREMFLESVNSAAVNTIGRQQIPIINNSVHLVTQLIKQPTIMFPFPQM